MTIKIGFLFIITLVSASLSHAELTKEDLKEIEEIVTKVVDNRFAILDSRMDSLDTKITEMDKRLTAQIETNGSKWERFRVCCMAIQLLQIGNNGPA